MQIHEEALGEGKRPCAPVDCAQCQGAQKLHCHRSYERNAHCTGEQKARVRRFHCPRCGLGIGVIPRGMLPYRSLPVERLEAWLDGQYGDLPPPVESVADGDARPPPASEVERGSLERARQRLRQRMALLCGLLGQRMPLLANDDIGGFWRALRAIGRLGGILVHLARSFKVSLLADYRSLSPNWPRPGASA